MVMVVTQILKEDEQRVKKIKMLNYKLANRKLNFGHEIFEIDKKTIAKRFA